MTKMTWMLPSLPYLVLGLVPAIIFYLLATAFEENGTSKAVTSLFFLGGSYVLGLGFLPILFFPLLLILVPLFLLTKLAAKEKKVKVAAALGLVTLLCALGYGQLVSTQGGHFHKLDTVRLNGESFNFLGSTIDKQYSNEDLVEALTSSSKRRQENAKFLILKRAKKGGEGSVSAFTSALTPETASDPDNKIVAEVLKDLNEMVTQPKPSPSPAGR